MSKSYFQNDVQDACTNVRNEEISTLLCNFHYAILLVNDNITRQDGSLIIDHYLRVVKGMSRLPINTVVTLWGCSELGLIRLNYVLLPREDFSEEHDSVGVGPLCRHDTWRSEELHC